MNDQKIFALMVRTPKIRAVQIADALDQELSDVSAALRSLVEVGDVVQSKGFSPNGHPAMVYDLSDTFKKSGEYKKLTGPAPTVAVAADEVVRAPEPVAPPPAAASAPTPVATKPDTADAVPEAVVAGAAGSKVSIAIAYLVKHGSATDAEMRAVMNIGLRTAPASYLATALKTGRVVRDGTTWLPGHAAQASSSAKVRPVRQPRASAPQLPAPAELRCALWSDGSLELQRGGATLALLAKTEVNFLTNYLAARAPG